MNTISRRKMLLMALLVPAADVAFAPGRVRSARADERSARPGPKFFVKGIYQQPVELMATWKSRGINTIFTVNGGGTLEQWTAGAMAQGLYMVRAPAGVDDYYNLVDRQAFERDIANPYLLAVALMDEPSNLKPGGEGITYDGVSATPARVDEIAKPLVSGGKPLWINHVGNHINNVYLEAIMSDYADSPYTDWIAQDSYPISSDADLVIDLDDYASTPQGHSIDRLLKWSGGRPQFSFVGLTKFDASMGRNTTPAELGVQVWSSIIHGSVGIIYFSFMFSPQFSYDATPEDLQKELVRLHADIDAIEHILVDKDKGGRRPYKLLRSVRQPGDAKDTLPFPFEACTIATDGGEYKIIQNLSSEPATLTYEPWGMKELTFEAYQCKRGLVPADFT